MVQSRSESIQYHLTVEGESEAHSDQKNYTAHDRIHEPFDLPFGKVFDDLQLIPHPNRVTEATHDEPNDFITPIVSLLERKGTTACTSRRRLGYTSTRTPMPYQSRRVRGSGCPLLKRKRVDITELHKAPCKHPANVSAPGLVKKADKTRHRDAVCDGHPKVILVDMSSGCPSGSTTAMTSHSYPQHELPMSRPPETWSPVLRLQVSNCRYQS